MCMPRVKLEEENLKSFLLKLSFAKNDKSKGHTLFDKYDATSKLEEIVYRGKTFTLS